jgi:hypothetical protein
MVAGKALAMSFYGGAWRPNIELELEMPIGCNKNM